MARHEKDAEKQQKIFGMMNDLRGEVIVLLQMFPGSENIVRGWINELTFKNGWKYLFSEVDKKYPIQGIN